MQQLVLQLPLSRHVRPDNKFDVALHILLPHNIFEWHRLGCCQKIEGQTLGDHKDTVPCLPWLTARHAVNMLKWIIVMVSRQDGAHFSFAQGALSRCSGGWCVEKLETAGGKAFSPSPSGTWAARTHLVTHIAQAQVSLHNGSAYAKGVASVVGELGRGDSLASLAIPAGP